MPTPISLPKDPLDWLQSEYDWRRLKNPRYSLRAFAQLAGVRSGRLSELLAGKRRLTPEACARMALRLGMAASECEQLVATLNAARQGSTRSKVPADSPASFHELSEDVFSQISDWYYLALLNVLTVEGQPQGAGDLAKRLGLNVAVVKRALKTFLRLGLIERNGERLVRTSKPITTSKDVPSQAIKKYHHQMLDKAHEALDSVPTSERDYSASLLCLNASSLTKIKDMIEKSRREIGKQGTRARQDRLYALTIQFFPLSKEPQQ